MGLFKKIVNVFYDDVEVEDEQVTEKEQEETKVEEISKPRIEEVHIPVENKPLVHEDVSEREIFKTESAKTFKFPLEDEEEDLPIKRTNRVNLDEEIKPQRREVKLGMYDHIEKPKPVEASVSTPKTFKPSPVISPVYGILDENYSKEDIVTRKEPIITRTENSEKDYDTIRRKAYGTLEDELENTLTKITKQEEKIEKVALDVNDLNIEENNRSIEDLLNEIKVNKNMSIGEAEEIIKDQMEQEEKEQEKEKPAHAQVEDLRAEEPEEVYDKTLEHDLFNLIDSMYEEKDVK